MDGFSFCIGIAVGILFMLIVVMFTSALAELQCIDFNKELWKHIHITPVTLDGKFPPGGIGLEQGCFREMHTHWADGWIHMESNAPRNFTMGEFFELWGLGTQGRSVMVNGENATFDTPLKNMDKVVVVTQ
jgi:hypothetical protein